MSQPSMSDVIQEQLKVKTQYINQSDGMIDRTECKKAVSLLEKSIRSTLYSSKSHETTFLFPFKKGCGKEVQDMLSTYKLEPIITSNNSIHTVDQLFVAFNLERNKVNVLLTK